MARRRQHTGVIWAWGGGVFLVLGLIWLGTGLATAFGPAKRPQATSSVLSLGVLSTAIAVWCLWRWRRHRSRPRDEQTLFQGATVRGGGVAAVSVAGDDLILETTEFRGWIGIVGLVAIAGVATLCALTLWRSGSSVPVALPVYVAFGAASHVLTRKVQRRFPIAGFVAMETAGRRLSLHRRDGGAPLEISLKSWQFGRLVELLRARHPDGLAADPPERDALRDEPEDDLRRDLREAHAAFHEWMPTVHPPAVTLAGVLLVTASLALGGFATLGLEPRSLRISAWAAWGVAVLVWAESRGRRAIAEGVRREFADPDDEALTVQVRRDRPDGAGGILPWAAARVELQDDRIVLVRRPLDGFEALALVGVATAGAWLVADSATPWFAAVYGLPLLLSGYPRRRTEEEWWPPSMVRALHDRGTGGTLEVEDEDGPRALELRYAAAHGRRLVALIRAECPGATVQEPGWRHRDPPATADRTESRRVPRTPATAGDLDAVHRRLVALDEHGVATDGARHPRDGSGSGGRA